MIKLSEIANEFGGTLEGEDKAIERLARLEEAGANELSFLSDPRYRKDAEQSNAAAILVKHDEPALAVSVVRVGNPYEVFTTLLQRIHPPLPEPTGIHPSAIIGRDVAISENVSIGPFSIIGDRTDIGAGTILYGHVVVGREVIIGKDCRIHPQVSLRDRVILRDRVTVKDGAVIGSEGFAFHPNEQGVYHSVPQLGTVVLEDDVSVGANSCVDRALSGATTIAKGTKLDNFVQVAHNVRLGEHNVIAAQTGISGSAKIGSNNRVGGQVGFGGHIKVGDRNEIGAQAGVIGNIGSAQKLWGTPAIGYRQRLRIDALLLKLEALFSRVKDIEQGGNDTK
ncbi:MAG: UDP-3-O-(3-hydroxymyristoyl)glucosamine N-acyltransferase [bacterium]|nr:UDP-3-O-(3-hydroxymyristoyl)glucosamine N-acyltransferase [bacterium]